MQIIAEHDKTAVDLAYEFLRAGKIISFPTDTIYALACDATNPDAVESLYKIKKRDSQKPIAIFLRDLEMAKKIFLFDETSEKIAKEFLPGALTLVLRTRDESASLLAKNLNKNLDGFLGFRIVDSFFVEKLLQKFNGILAVTSANISGEESVTDPRNIVKNFPNLSLLVKGEISRQAASTVAKITNNQITILRQGPILL